MFFLLLLNLSYITLEARLHKCEGYLERQPLKSFKSKLGVIRINDQALRAK